MEVQSVLFDITQFSGKEAKTWLRDHGYKVKWIGEKGLQYTANYLRFRQNDPKKYKSYAVREISPGIKIIWAIPK